MNYIPIATIAKPHGVKGAVKVKTDTDFKELRYKEGNTLYLMTSPEVKEVTVKQFQVQNQNDILTFEEYDDINKVEVLRGVTIAILDESRHSLPSDEFYFDELIGLKVYVNDEYKGEITRVEPYPQGEMLRIKRDNQKDALLPFLKEFVKHVDVKNKRVDCVELEGLL